mgnify:CR=1 FL=1
MYRQQNGFFPTLCRFFGLIMISISMIFLVPGLIPLLYPQVLLGNMLANTSGVFPSCFIFGMFFISLFPRLRLTENGVRYRFMFFTGTIRWEEIKHISQARNGIILISIYRKGFFLFNGLFFQGLLAWFIGNDFPLLLISSSLVQRNQFMQEILSRGGVKGM